MNEIKLVPSPPYWWSSSGPRPIEQLASILSEHRQAGRRIITTNGCFDLLHMGHVDFLARACALGDLLIVGLNSDPSVRKLKGPDRPLFSEDERAGMLAALEAVDHVIVFDETLPNKFLSFIQPDLHCKSGDYTADDLPEAATVRQFGGDVVILPLTEGYSSSRLVQLIINQTLNAGPSSSSVDGGESNISAATAYFLDSSNVYRQIAYQLAQTVEQAAVRMINSLNSGHKILTCGNGGSAADSQHFATELMVRYRKERQAIPAIALTTDTSLLTAVSNDLGFEHAFARQVAGLGNPGDILVAISTSGTSPNVLRAVSAAKSRELFVIGLTGKDDSPLAHAVDLNLAVPSQDTPQIQQGHLAILHVLCDLIEQAFS